MKKHALHISGLVLLAPAAFFGQVLVPSQDAYVVPGSGTNFGTSVNITVGSSASQGLVQFDLASLPAGLSASQVQKATVTLYVNKLNSAGTFNVYEANGPWTESGVTGLNAPVPGALVASSVPVSQPAQFITVDATAAVQAWITTPSNNAGFLIVPNGGASAQFDSKESTNTSHSAVLAVLLASSGPAGPTGAAGPTGPTGAAGVAGATGPAGGIGPTGPAGIPGATGPAGSAGANGSTGPAGANGVTGPTGATGANATAAGTWSAGGGSGSGGSYNAGDVVFYSPTQSSYISSASNNTATPPAAPWQLLAAQGPTGSQGATGPTGLTGATGIGTTGAAGATGPAGPAGATGPTGPAGSAGSGATPTAIPLTINAHQTGATTQEFFNPSNGSVGTTLSTVNTVTIPASCKPSMTVYSYENNTITWTMNTVTPSNTTSTWTLGSAIATTPATCQTTATVGSSCTVTATSNLTTAGTVITITNSGTLNAGGATIAFSCQ